MKNSLMKFALLFSLALVSVFSANAAVVVSGSAGAADGSYTTVKQAFDALNVVAVSQSGRTISIAISANTTETASAVLSAANDDWTALNIYPSSTNITISSAAGLSAPMLDLNGVNNVTIWGSNGGSPGTSQDLTINNQSTNSSACAVRFVDGASNCILKYCILKSSGSSNVGQAGVVQVRNSAGSSGNSNINITNNQITSSTGGRSSSGVYVLGAATKVNTNITVSNNTIYDYILSASWVSNGIRFGNYNTGCTISDNTIYETTSLALSGAYAGSVFGILVGNVDGSYQPSVTTGTYDITVSNNYIGGSAADHSGTFTKTNSAHNKFYALVLFPASGGTGNSIQGNTINNISWTQANNTSVVGTKQFVNIYAGGSGDINIGTSSGNTVGATTGTGGITLTEGNNASAGEYFYGINIEGTGTITCSNNNIGSITVANSSASYNGHFTGINKSGTGTIAISNNLIGSLTTANSVNLTSASTGVAQVMYGIYNTGSGNLTISGNTIKNLNNACASSGTNPGTICGIYNSGGSGTNTVNKNFITNFTTAAPGTPASNNSNKLYGIQIAAGTTTYANNVISLGDATPTTVYGLYQTSGSGTNSLLYNTINVTGTPLTGTTILSYALYSTGTSNTRIFRNNICANTRSNGGTASGSHYAIYVAATGGTYFIDFNDYYAPNTGGVLGYYAANKTTLANFQATSGQDLSSVNTDPTFAAYTGTASELKPQSATTLFANYNVNVLTDYAGTTRSVTVPCIGAFEGLVAPTAPASNIDLVISSVVRTRYTTLKAAFDAINCGSFSTSDDITLRITGNTTETAAAVLNPKSTNYSSVTIYPTTTGLSISGSLTTPLIDLNGSSSVTIDGRLYNSDGSALVSGNAQNLTITNTSTSSTAGTCAIRVYNNTTTPADYATTIKYCILKASTTDASGGIILLSSTTNASSCMTGVTITSNKITCAADGSRPLNAIYSAGFSATKYNRLTISSNKIYDFLSRGTASNGINLAGYNYTCSITGNSFYESASFVPTANVAYNIIYVSSTNSKDISITSNYIGGSAAYCASTAWTKTAAFTNTFNGINVQVGATIATTTTLDNNVIKNISWSDAGPSSWTAITTASSTGDVNIGKVSGNYIGSTGVSPYSIIVTAGNTNANMYGIYIGSTGTTNCENNYIYGFKVDNTGTNKATNLYAIIKSNTAGTTTIKGNTIGDPNTSASIYNAAAADPNWPTNQTTCGIKNLGTGTISIDYNTITNMSVASTKSGTGQYIEVSTYGVFSVAGTNSITNNTISNIITACSYDNGFYQLQNACIGIGLFSTTAVANTISGNVVHSLSNTNSSFGGCIVGIAYNGGTTASAIKNNFIYNLSVHASSTSGYLHGIFANAGVATYSNNVISLGGNTKTTIYGIYDTGAASQTCSIFYNTIYLSGTVGSGATNKSACLWNNAASNTRDYRNNIFHNTRTTTSGSNLHYTLYCVASTGTLNSNYNDYKITAAAGQTLGYFAANVTALPIVTGKTGNDANSLTTDPGYTPSTTPISFKPTSLTLNGTDLSGLSLTKDFNQNMRSTTAPCMGAWETETNKWVGGTSTDFELAANWSGGIVPAADEAIAFHDNPDRDCYLTANRSITDLTINQSTDKLYTNGYTLTIKGDLNLSNSAKIDASAASSTVVLNKQTPLTLPASCFVNDQVYNLTINSPYNVKYNGNITLLNTLTATSSKLDVFTNSPTFTYGGSSAQTINTGLFPGDSIKNLVIDNAAGVSLATDFIVNTSLTINSEKNLTIPVTKKLVVTGTITNNAGVSGLVVKADPAGLLANGTLIFYNAVGSPVTGTVELYTKAVNPKKQYIGIPLRSTTYNGSFSSRSLHTMNENVVGGASSVVWTRQSGNSALTSFVGYALGSTSAGVVSFQGTLENGNFSSGQLSYSPAATYVGQHLLANSYTAALDITALTFGSSDPSIIDNTVYVFNTGSYDDWEAAGSGTTFGSAPGQYTSVPINVAGLNGLPSQIPSMGGFLVKVKSNNAAASVGWNYNSAFLTKNTELLKSKRAPLISTRLNVKGSKNSFDCIWMITNSKCSHNFDNGWDGEKSLAGAGTLQLFAAEKDGKNYQVASVDNVNDTYLSFQASKNDTSYTMMFNHENLSDAYSTLYLVDLELNKTIDISETGTTYSFESKQTASPSKRFKIVTNFEESGIATQVDGTSTEISIVSTGNKIEVINKYNCEGALYIYNMSGEFIKKFKISPDSKSLHEPELPTGAYVAKVNLLNGKTISQKVLLP